MTWPLIYCELNSWHWPEAFSSIKPPTWNDLNNFGRSQHPGFRAIVALAREMTTEKERSKAWNCRWHDTPEDVWQKWWDSARTSSDIVDWHLQNKNA